MAGIRLPYDILDRKLAHGNGATSGEDWYEPYGWRKAGVFCGPK